MNQKTDWAHWSAVRELLESGRELGHAGLLIQHSVLDRAIMSSLSRHFGSAFRLAHEHFTQGMGPGQKWLVDRTGHGPRARLSDLIPYSASRYCQEKNVTKTTSMHRVRHCRLVLVSWIKIMFMHSVSDTFKCSHPSALPHHRLNRSAQ